MPGASFFQALSLKPACAKYSPMKFCIDCFVMLKPSRFKPIFFFLVFRLFYFCLRLGYFKEVVFDFRFDC
jgi:hypothetical protein